LDWERKASTIEKWLAKNLLYERGKHFKDIRTRDKRNNERELKAMPREEVTAADKYEVDILEIDSLMYIPVD
jgi:hypothetical protein